MRRVLAPALFALALAMVPAHAAAQPPRLFVLTDIGNEPDDQMSLVRLLLYANEIDIEGIAATTSVWQRGKVSPEIAAGVIDAYGEVLPHLRENAPGWPDAAQLRARLHPGVAGYGLAAVNPDKPSAGALALLAAARRDVGQPLWVSAWGGTNTLAEALLLARKTLPETEVKALVARLRVYAISDQDDAGPWLRREFPGLFWIGTPSGEDSANYAAATWTGISGDLFYRNGQGADGRTVTNAWLDANVRAKGPLGAHYPRFMFIMEGDTPSFLGLIPNGLQNGDRPDWGGWGGRYLLRRPHGEARALWTQGGDSFPRVTSADTVNGVTSDQATIWRWREAFQHDFAARMDWTVKPYKAANHPPEVVVNGQGGNEPLRLEAQVGQAVRLDASASRDPDGNRLTYRWFGYGEAGFAGGMFPPPPLAISGAAGPRATITATAACGQNWLAMGTCPDGLEAHAILAITDNGRPALTRYRRVILTVRKSGRDK
ncbi:MAG: DUF1593 domain-containing protein [Sphingomonadales bacterium]|nr:DUF1593 domain-containing protein [Sphingomonadales bacterium]